MILLADSEGPDQSARMRRLIRAFTARISSNEEVGGGGWGRFVATLISLP